MNGFASQSWGYCCSPNAQQRPNFTSLGVTNGLILTNSSCNRVSGHYGVVIGRGTLNAWTHAAADHLAPVGEAIKAELFEAEVLQVDETPASYLNPGLGKTGQGCLWIYLDPGRGTVYYDWRLGRGHDCLVDIMGVDEEAGTTCFQGVIQCDGYSAYTAFVARYGGVELGGCLAHIRRKFYDARDQAPDVVPPILTDIQELYRIERWLRQTKAPPECRGLVRRARARPIVEALHRKILDERKSHLPKSNLGGAIGYALNQWEAFTLYLERGELEIDNNLVKNAIRPTKLGLKNYLFFGSAGAGKNSALIYTLLDNCAANQIDPEIYLAEAIRRLPTNPTPDQAAALTPSKFACTLRNEDAAAA